MTFKNDLCMARPAGNDEGGYNLHCFLRKVLETLPYLPSSTLKSTATFRVNDDVVVPLLSFFTNTLLSRYRRDVLCEGKVKS